MLSDILAKLNTVLLDRRLWFAVILPFVALWKGLPEDDVAPYVQAAYLLVSTAFLNISWATRPPSGRSFKSDAILALDKLRDLGVLK